MRITTFFSAVLVALLAQSCLSQTVKVSNRITYYKPYCGGARPTPQMEADAQTPKAYAGRTILVVSDKGKVDSAKTNANGSVSLKLKQGSYRLLESWRYYRQSPDGSDINRFVDSCLRLEWSKEFETIVVRKKKATIVPKMEIIEQCPWRTPCLKESEMPPMPE
jgi:hypothetical protein